MSNYIESYKARISHLGNTPQTKAFNSGRLEFKRYLKYNEHTIKGLQIDNKKFDGVILTNKEDENKVTQILLTELSVPIHVGDIIYWSDEPWIIYRDTTSSYQPYNKFYIVKCNYKIKWVNEDGSLESSWAHIVGGLDSKIKDNFRTWNSLITPQPNKYVEILMPVKPIPKTVEILINDEAWYLVDYDKVSVPGIIYMSFTESKVNSLHDNVEKQIANYDKIANIQITGLSTIQAAIGDEIVPDYTIYLDGVPNKEVEPEIFISGNLTTDGEKITVYGDGKVIIRYKDVTFEQSIITGESELQAILDGPEKLRVTQSATYEIVANFPLENIEFTLSNNLASIVSYSENSCVIKGNDKNKIGDVILTVNVNNITLSKTIQIISLWQVI